jgi:hypothetical protein
MHNQFTLFSTVVKVFIVAVFCTIVAIIGYNVYLFAHDGNSNISMGLTGMTETRCIDGYKFVTGVNGHITQMLDAQGKGIQCQ